MKHCILFAVLAVLLIAVPAAAQINLNYTTALNRVTITASTNDTGTVAGQYVGGANLLSLVVSSEDSIAVDVIVEYQKDMVWTSILTDSLISTVASGHTHEYSIRDSDSDLLDGIYFPLRVIIAARATGCGVTTPYLTARWYYRI
jgi:hypothetical protein